MNSTNHISKIVSYQFSIHSLKIILLFFFLSFLPISLFAQGGYDTKLIFGYTAKPLKVKQGYIHTIDLFLYEAEVGITSFLSVGIGSSIFVLSKDDILRGFVLKTKITFPIDKNIHMGVGTYVFREFGDNNSSPENTIITNGIVSFNLGRIQSTFGAGFGSKFSQDGFDDEKTPVVTFGTIIPLSKKIYLVSESWIIDGVFISGLVFRWNRNQFSYELGALGAAQFVIPQLGISFHF